MNGPAPLSQKKVIIIVCACAILKDRPVCYGTSRLKNRVCAVTRCALLKTRMCDTTAMGHYD